MFTMINGIIIQLNKGIKQRGMPWEAPGEKILNGFNVHPISYPKLAGGKASKPAGTGAGVGTDLGVWKGWQQTRNVEMAPCVGDSHPVRSLQWGWRPQTLLGAPGPRESGRESRVRHPQCTEDQPHKARAELCPPQTRSCDPRRAFPAPPGV